MLFPYFIGCRNGDNARSLVVTLKNLTPKRRFSGHNLSNGSTVSTRLSTRSCEKNYYAIQMSEVSPCSSEESTPRRRIDTSRIIRSSNQERNRKSKIRVIRMLFVMMIEFFICWTPLYTVQTWRSFHAESANENMTSVILSLIFVLCYTSSCCNPITYCFMNTRFRQAFFCAIKKCFCCGQSTNDYFSRYSYSTHRQTFQMAPKEEETYLSSTDKSKCGDQL